MKIIFFEMQNSSSSSKGVMRGLVKTYTESKGATIQKVEQIFNKEEDRHLYSNNRAFDTLLKIISAQTDLSAQLKKVSTNFYKGSIAYVFKGITKSDQELAIKIKRPNLEEIVENDFNNVNSLIDKISSFLPTSKFSHMNNFSNQFIDDMKSEQDFKNEIKNHLDLRKQIKSFKHVTMPKLYNEFSNDEVIVYEWVEQTIPLDAINSHKHETEIFDELLRLFFETPFTMGDFQEDTNLNNFILTDDKLYLIDFGKVSYLKATERSVVSKLIYGRKNKLRIDYLGLLVELGFNKELLRPMESKLSSFLDIIFEPWLAEGNYCINNWNPVEKIDLLFGDYKWNLRSASPYIYFKLTRSMIGIKKLFSFGEHKTNIFKTIYNNVIQDHFSELESLTESDFEKDKEQIINIIVKEDGREKVNIKLPFIVIYDIKSYISSETLVKIKSKGIDLDKVVRDALVNERTEIFTLTDNSSQFIVKII
jgi:hypothetical protein